MGKSILDSTYKVRITDISLHHFPKKRISLNIQNEDETLRCSSDNVFEDDYVHVNEKKKTICLIKTFQRIVLKKTTDYF